MEDAKVLEDMQRNENVEFQNGYTKCFISNAVFERPVDRFQILKGVA